jgi:hypothetical protein
VSFGVEKPLSSQVSDPHVALSSKRSLVLPDALVALTTVCDALLSSASLPDRFNIGGRIKRVE